MNVYKYKTESDTVIFLHRHERLNVISSYGGRWLTIGDNIIIIPANYSWDGCSPKFRIFGKIIGSPDFGSKTKNASLVHDALYQYAGLHSITKEECDFIFFSLMKRERFKLAKFYYWAVKYFGSIAWNHWKNFNLGKLI